MSASSLSEIVIRIRALFDRSGTEAAKRALRETSAEVEGAASGAGKAKNAFGDMFSDETIGRGNKANRVIGDVQQTLGGLQGGVNGVASSMQGLIKLFPALAAAAGPIGILVAAVAGLVKAFGYLQEKAAAAYSSLQQNQIENITSSAERLTAAYKKQRDELQRVLDVRNRLNSAGDENTTAQRRLEDAQAETDFQATLATAGTDEVLKTELTAEYNLMKAQLAVARELEDSATQSARIEEETNTILLQRQLMLDEYAEKEQLVLRLIEMQKYNISELMGQTRRSNIEVGTMGSKAKAQIEVGGNISGQVNAILDSMGELRKQINDVPVTQQVNQIRQQTEVVNQSIAGEKGAQADQAYGVVQNTALDAEFQRLNQNLAGSSAATYRQFQSIVDSLLAMDRLKVDEMRRLNTGIEQQISQGRHF